MNEIAAWCVERLKNAREGPADKCRDHTARQPEGLKGIWRKVWFALFSAILAAYVAASGLSNHEMKAGASPAQLVVHIIIATLDGVRANEAQQEERGHARSEAAGSSPAVRSNVLINLVGPCRSTGRAQS